MLYPVKKVFNSKFLDETEDGLLVIFDQINRTVCLGQIEEIALHEEGTQVKLGANITRKEGQSGWEKREFHTFEIHDIGHFSALEQNGGFYYTDSTMQESTFRIYPASLIPTEYDHNHETLIGYGGSSE